MDFSKVISFLFMFFGAGIMVVAYLVKYKKMTSLISALTEKRLRKITKLQVLLDAYSKSLLLIAMGCFIAAMLLQVSRIIGIIVGILIILVGVISLSSTTADIDEKIKKRIY